MTATTIEVTLLIGGEAFNLQMVGDPDDVMTAMNVGRAVTTCLIEYASAERKRHDDAGR